MRRDPEAVVSEIEAMAPMQAEEFAEIRHSLGWTQARTATWLGVGEQMVIGYEAGRFPIPTGRANHWRITKRCLT